MDCINLEAFQVVPPCSAVHCELKTILSVSLGLPERYRITDGIQSFTDDLLLALKGLEMYLGLPLSTSAAQTNERLLIRKSLISVVYT